MPESVGDPSSPLLALIAVIAAPLAEETFFRGFLQDVIGRQYPARGKWFAALVAAFAFAAVHPPLSFAPVLMLGLATGALYAWTGSIGPGLLAHAAHNLVVVLIARK